MKYFSIITDLPVFDSDELLSTLSFMLQEEKVHWGGSNQICLNTTADHVNDYTFGCGSLAYDWSNKQSTTVDGITSIKVQPRSKVYHDRDFTILCDQFKGTIFEKVYTALESKYQLGRVRLMMSLPKTCLSWHHDTTPRIHFPIKTQLGCSMVIEDEVIHLTKSHWWSTDTTRMHTAFNASLESRIHLVASVIQKYE